MPKTGGEIKGTENGNSRLDRTARFNLGNRYMIPEIQRRLHGASVVGRRVVRSGLYGLSGTPVHRPDSNGHLRPQTPQFGPPPDASPPETEMVVLFRPVGGPHREMGHPMLSAPVAEDQAGVIAVRSLLSVEPN